MINNITIRLLTDESFSPIIENLAKNVHNQWMFGRLSENWTYGKERNDKKREHPSLIPYEMLSEEEKDYDRKTVKATLLYLLENGFEIRRLVDL